MKKIICSLFVLVLSFSLFGKEKTAEIKVGVLNGPTCIPSAYLMNKKNSSYDFEVFADPTALIPKMIKQEIDIGFLPVNAAAKVYKASNKMIICCAVTGNGNLTLITKNKNIKKLTDLKGKKVYVAGQGATPEYMFSYLIKQNGLSINSSNGITLDFSIPNNQLAAYLINDKIKYAVVPEPFSTIAKTKCPDIITAVDLQSEYESLEGEGKIYPLSVMVVRKDFAVKNPLLLEQFLSDYAAAVEWTINHPMQSGKLCQKYDLGLDPVIVSKAIPNANYTFERASMAKKSMEDLLSIFLDFAPEAIGGQLPDEEFYYR